MILAFTGATGFLGSHLLDRALGEGHGVRALTRRPQAPREGVTWIDGSLDRANALAALADGAEAVVHVAGLVDAPDRASFAAGNIEGTRAVLAAAAGAGVRRFVQVSSLAAREPALSDYGWSKAEADRLVTMSGLDWTIVRPPAIFGPRDRELLALFRLLARGWGVLPVGPAGQRMSLVAAEDLARLLLSLATRTALVRQTIEPDDGTADGWDTRDFIRAIAAAVGRRALPIPLPRAPLLLAAQLTSRLPGPLAKLTPDRARYFAHRDWACHARPPAELWIARLDTHAALAATAAWYRANGLL